MTSFFSITPKKFQLKSSSKKLFFKKCIVILVVIVITNTHTLAHTECLANLDTVLIKVVRQLFSYHFWCELCFCVITKCLSKIAILKTILSGRVISENWHETKTKPTHIRCKLVQFCDTLGTDRGIKASDPWPQQKNAVSFLSSAEEDIHLSTFNNEEGSPRKSYRVYQGFRLNPEKRREMVVFGSLLTTFEVSSIFWSNWIVVNIGLSLKSNSEIKLSLSRSLIRILDVWEED